MDTAFATAELTLVVAKGIFYVLLSSWIAVAIPVMLTLFEERHR